MNQAANRILLPVLGLFGAVAILAAGRWVGRRLARGAAIGLPGWELIAGLVLGVFLVLAIHELGHVLVGRWNGFDFHWLCVGPFRVDRDPVTRAVRVGWNRSWLAAWGLTLLLPRGESRLLSRIAWMAAGGPLASLAFGIAMAAAAALTSHADWRIWFAVVSAFSLAICLFTFLPGLFGALGSDGGRVIQMLRGSADAELHARLTSILGADYAGIPPSQWNSEWMQAFAAESGEGLERAGALGFAYIWRLDRGEFEEAGGLLARQLERIESLPEAVRASVRLEAAWFAAARRGNLSEAESLFSLAAGMASADETVKLRAESAIAALRGQVETASQKSREARAALSTAEMRASSAVFGKLLAEPQDNRI